MKAPDKIFAHRKEKPLEVTWSEVEEKGCVNIEYIRKDFLIDKLARAKALREKSGSKDTEVIEVLTNLIKEL